MIVNRLILSSSVSELKNSFSNNVCRVIEVAIKNKKTLSKEQKNAKEGNQQLKTQKKCVKKRVQIDKPIKDSVKPPAEPTRSSLRIKEKNKGKVPILLKQQESVVSASDEGSDDESEYKTTRKQKVKVNMKETVEDEKPKLKQTGITTHTKVFVKPGTPGIVLVVDIIN